MYNQLPSHVAEHATTFDLMVTEIYATWEKYKANPTEANYADSQLEEIMKKARE